MPKMVVTSVYTMTNNNEQRTTNYSKQSQNKPKQSQFYRHSVWRKFIKNPLEILIDFDSNQLWHKSLKQNQPRQFSTIQAIWRTIQCYFEDHSRTIRDNSRVIGANSRQLALWLTPSLNPAHLAKNHPQTPAHLLTFLAHFCTFLKKTYAFD